MAGGQEYSRYQKGVIHRYYEHIDTIALQKLSELVSDLYMAEGGHATKLWNTARAALAKLAPEDDPHVLKVLSVRSVAGLAKLVNDLSANAKATGRDTPHPHSEPVIEGLAASTPPAPVVAPAAPAPPAAPPTPDDLKHAMKAFRKRLKLTRLDEESKLGRTGNPMSSGRKSQVQAIMPPREYPKPVWDELVKQGKLKSAGGSFYELVEGQ